MTPDQAIALLNSVCAEAPATRRVHSEVIKALEILQKMIKDNTSKKETVTTG